MQAVLERMKALPFFRSLSEETCRDVAEAGCWHSVAGGWQLFAQGQVSDRVDFLLSGRFVVVRRNDAADEVVGYIRAGEPAGEMSLLAGGLHSASVFALRDSEVLSIDRVTFEELITKHGDFASELARLALARARKPKLTGNRSAPRVFALVATSRSIDIDALAERLTEKVTALGFRSTCLTMRDDAPDSFEFDRLEEDHDITFIATRVDGSAWYRFVLRHADRFLVVVRRDARPPKPFPMTTEDGKRARKFRLVDLVMLDEGVKSCATTEWLDALGATRVFHLRAANCYDRLARVVTGQSVSVIFSGGGARAYAHIGVIKALRESGIVVDFACGASMGAIIAACVSMGWDNQEIDDRIRDAFVESNPLGDYVLPVVALTRGRLVEERLARHFGDTLIEDMDTPFFCVSSELTAGVPFVHRRGLLRDALRASISLPGILPPVVQDGALLVDGAVMNNFPADLMADMHRGVTIGVDVARRGTISADPFIDSPGFLSWVRQNGFSAAPPIVSLLMRSASARRELSTEQDAADLMVTPVVAGVELRDWKKYDDAVEDGYESAMRALEENWERVTQDATVGRARK